MAIDRRRFLALLALGVPVTLRASKQASASTNVGHPVSPPVPTNARQQAAPETSPAKVLIVDDSKNEREGLAEMLWAWGYRVETACDGLEAWDKITQWSPAIVLTDLKMPRMGGMALLERLAEHNRVDHNLAVIVMTAQGTIDSAVQAMRIGAYDYITKPIDTSRLRTILQNASFLLGFAASSERGVPYGNR
jgi:CheY-like chemotaxis protein